MPENDFRKTPRAALKMLYTLLFSLLPLAWIEQDAIALYWRQIHHKDAPLEFLKRFSIWRSGARLNDAPARLKTSLTSEVSRFDEWAISTFNARPGADKPERLALAVPPENPESHWPQEKLELKLSRFIMERFPPTVDNKAGNHLDSGEAATAMEAPSGGAVRLSGADKVLFIGDSLMQGIAPYVNAGLYKRHAIRSFDLSKQSTGLAYPAFFNWPSQVKKTFLEKPDIKLMVVFLGPNDPWDFPHPQGNPYLKFGSENWETVYRGRIRELLETAQKNGARVLWLAPPCMRKKELNMRMAYLSGLFSDEVKNSREFFLPTGSIVGCDSERFASFMDSGGKKIKARSDDGIHFTLAGQKKIANEILSFIHIVPREAAQ
ncbi:MAG: DUF459 domain-containing protein [Candidatus Accumulibacter sp.]|nr:DUF459 domain-containing protein [Accumulibacter sp.]